MTDTVQDAPTLVFVGVATQDAIALVDRYPKQDERVVAEEVLFAGGGPAATAAVAAARLGMRAAVVAVVGDDEEGAKIVHDLEAEGVDVSGIQTSPGERSARSLVIISGPDKTRAIANRPGPRLSLQNNERARELIDGASWVHVDQHGWAATRSYLDELSRPPRLSVDGGNPIPGYRAANTELYAPTRDALIERYARPDAANDIESLLCRATDDGARIAVATGGADGSFAFSREAGAVRAPTPSTRIVSTLGAGDVFHGALLAGLTLADNGVLPGGLADALAYATATASLSCRGIDGRSRIPSHDETMLSLAPMANR